MSIPCFNKETTIYYYLTIKVNIRYTRLDKNCIRFGGSIQQLQWYLVFIQVSRANLKRHYPCAGLRHCIFMLYLQTPTMCIVNDSKQGDADPIIIFKIRIDSVMFLSILIMVVYFLESFTVTKHQTNTSLSMTKHKRIN